MAAAGSTVGAAPLLGVTLNARAFQPGELIVVTIAAPPATRTVRVTALGEERDAVVVDSGAWQALVGVDLAERPGRSEIVVSARIGSETFVVKEPLKVEHKAFPVRTLQVDPAFVNPPPSAAERIRDEAAFVQSVHARSAHERLWSAPFERPVPGPSNGRFGARSVFNGEARSPHSGADFSSEAGTPVKAPNAGKVVAARELFFTGNTVIIDHGAGVVSLLAHLSRIDVHEGDLAAPGEIIGAVGATGRVTGPHLHWAVRVGRARVDPLSLLSVLGPIEEAHPTRE